MTIGPHALPLPALVAVDGGLVLAEVPQERTGEFCDRNNAEQDSPTFTPEALRQFAARGYRRHGRKLR